MKCLLRVAVKVCCTKALYSLLYAEIKQHKQAKHHRIDSYFILNAFKVIFARAMIFNGVWRTAVVLVEMK